jgi:hypothetical protein
VDPSQGYGPLDGRYLITNVTGSYLSPICTVTMELPTASLPEPAPDTGTRQVGRPAKTLGPSGTAGPTTLGSAKLTRAQLGFHPQPHDRISRLAATILASWPNLQVTATTDGNHVPGSYHYQGLAVDLATPLPQTAERTKYMNDAAKWIAKNFPQITELIHNPGPAIKDGRSVNGAVVYESVWAGHTNHIHVAWADPITEVPSARVVHGSTRTDRVR